VADNPIPALTLPKRFEILAANARKAGVDPREVVERVDTAAARVDELLRRIASSGCGQLELFLGLSGSGKTTFVSTLPKFFHEISVHTFDAENPLTELPAFIRTTASQPAAHRVVLVAGRDNPKAVDLASARQVFDALRELFRTPEGSALVLWPITAESDAFRLAADAWEVGRDSVVDIRTKGLFRFEGVPKSRYFDIADVTSRNLSGDGLEAFGVTRSTADSLLPNAETITGFFYLVEEEAARVRAETWSVLKERVRPRLWIALPGDDPDAIDAAVLGLTQGTRNRIDIDLIAEFIDNPASNANYIADWRRRRAKLAHIMRALDVRLFGLPPNVALAAIRVFGGSDLRARLKQPSTNLSAAQTALRRSRLYKAILAAAGVVPEPFAGGGVIGDETKDEYRRVQTQAAARDKTLNKALGQLIEVTLAEDGITCTVVSEKQALPGSSLKPDVQIVLADQTHICIEPTWRTTGAGVEGEVKSAQNTLAVAHIKKYVLDKVTEYVKDLDL